MYGTAAGPLSTHGALSAGDNAGIYSLHMKSISSACNPSSDYFHTPLEYSQILSSVQAFPYPMPTTATLHDMSALGACFNDSPLCLTDPYLCEQLSEGVFSSHGPAGLAAWLDAPWHTLRPNFGATEPCDMGSTFAGVERALTRSHEEAANAQGRVLASARGGGLYLKDVNSTPGGVTLLRGKLVDAFLYEFRAIPYAVLLRLGALRYMQAMAAAMPEAFSGEGKAAGLREE